MDDLPLDGRHRLELGATAGRRDALGRAARDSLERRRPPGAVARRVDDDLVLAALRARDRVREVLDRVDRLAVLPDEERDVGATGSVTVTTPSRSRAEIETSAPMAAAMRSTISFGVLAALVRFGLVGSALAGRRRDTRDDPRRGEPDAEQPTLSLRDDLELHLLAIEAGNARLELAQRSPLGLADGLAGRLDGDRRSPRSSAAAALRRASS